MEDGTKKGTVTSLDALFAPEEAEKAARRVEEAIANRRNELGRLRDFVSDNAALISLVQNLPDELSHEIMVPFGGAAFFPGRLIHTNEFLVLLGEGYYAERTAKQTVDILQRRGKALEVQVAAVKATVLDMEAEARFFGSTAAEAAEGLVEIREEYVEQIQEGVLEKALCASGSQSSSKADKLDNRDEDVEHARIMARLDELEKEELEAGSASGDDEDEDVVANNEDEDAAASNGNKDAVTNDEDEHDKTSVYLSTSMDYVNRHALGSNVDDRASNEREGGNSGFGFSTSRDVIDDHVRGIEKTTDSMQKLGVQEMSDPTAVKPLDANCKQNFLNQGSVVDSKVQVSAKAVSFRGDNEKSVQSSSVLPLNPKDSAPELQYSSEDSARQTSMINPSGRKDFIGSIVEHTHGLLQIQSPKSATPNQPSSSNPSRPVSRFKMMQKGRR
ncbi:uncharacterized protein [Typha latifolia]|uniref:uncharacterized protein isoform X1 n=1 Tax=Typha latifolia TaxID=4733 RepID=UPI003C2BE2DC